MQHVPTRTHLLRNRQQLQVTDNLVQKLQAILQPPNVVTLEVPADMLPKAQSQPVAVQVVTPTPRQDPGHREQVTHISEFKLDLC